MLQIGQKRREKQLGFGERKSRAMLLVAVLGDSRGTGTCAGTARSSQCPRGVPVGSQPGAVPPCDPLRCVLNPPTGCPQPWGPGCGTEGCPMSPPPVSPSPGVPPAPTPHQGHVVAAATGTRDRGRSPPCRLPQTTAPVLGGHCPNVGDTRVSHLPAALTHLLVVTVVAGLLTAVICVAALALLAVKLWPR